jgi:hypothetical protein
MIGDYWRNWEILGSKLQLRKELLTLMETISINIILFNQEAGVAQSV